MNTNKKNPKKPQIFLCKICDFNTCNKKDFTRHVSTDKHIKLTNPNIKTQKTSFNCNCGKSYRHSSSLSLHKKKCKPTELDLKNNTENFTNQKELIMILLQQNNELQNKIIDLCKEKSIMNINNNSHNKTFNLQVFLNETCKNAMNITDFINSLQLQLSDLENVGEVGYIEGISNIIIKNLNALDVTERPVHCTDKKRETMYVKDEDKWEKEDENKDKMHKMVRKIANKNIYLISQFREKYPDYKKTSSVVSDQFNKIIIESMGGNGDNEYAKEDKIIRKIAKEVFVDKSI